MRRKSLTVISLAVLLTASLAGCGTTGSSATGTSGGGASPTSSPKSTGPVLGSPFDVKQSEGTAQITIESASYGASLGGTFDTPAVNGGYLILDVLWETSAGRTTANPLYLKAKDADGHEGEFAVGVPTPLGSGDVPAGDKTRGNIAFDLGAGPYTVAVTDQLLQEKARLTVNATPR